MRSTVTVDLAVLLCVICWRAINRSLIKLPHDFEPIVSVSICALVLKFFDTLNLMRMGSCVTSFVSALADAALICCGFLALAAIQSLFAGMILSVIRQSDRERFEADLQRVHNTKGA